MNSALRRLHAPFDPRADAWRKMCVRVHACGLCRYPHHAPQTCPYTVQQNFLEDCKVFLESKVALACVGGLSLRTVKSFDECRIPYQASPGVVVTPCPQHVTCSHLVSARSGPSKVQRFRVVVLLVTACKCSTSARGPLRLRTFQHPSVSENTWQTSP